LTYHPTIYHLFRPNTTMDFWDVFKYALWFIGGALFLLIVVLSFLVSRGLEERDGPTGKPFTFHERIFYNVANDLTSYARMFKITYNEINIIVYYFLIPFSWLVLLDLIFEFHYLKIGFGVFSLVFFLVCKDFRSFSNKLFRKSVNFLNYFNRFGSNYIISSVWFCVFVPIGIYAFLIYLLFH
jgi:hypothetical protein